MILAKVVGHVVATQKCDELRGSNLLLITALDDEQQPIRNKTWVAVDSVGAGLHDIVLAESWFALNKDRYKAMSVVAIVENVFRDA
ncbi:EutN/CcmL family microcompartment protein [Yokenella regensburgei]|jgi:microcompartment protein CcmK/EutM|uniref:Carbon dioxide concentrating mechanism protein CcmL n=1 Tax=Yokenella regensburgei TaxID=158877 RepID=A0AB38FXU0_9ENTR|nr:EutN/CcmL family microcompartment protein [Yokenella regensburgei]EHM44494.1 ethanolamine utilization protein EutN/carboxysome structural protein Ccml [Yokenella regensburgei ATCC 43003]KAF1368673.1 microcompartment protein CcmK/EutM [Yokenella regensburgei]KFD23706.1 CcmL family carbon dioxide concentrating mechanism protein [Yokenella regensburgei ATCC 49455]RKR63513.1 microcompartment protein CcmK/EutM [Yokenella regensburgei]SQA63779.1 Carbon dioxide concentrating mechanism protein CcmL